MIAFLDTEFTNLLANPLLLSVGIVMGNPGSEEFYAEVNDPSRIGAAGSYARDIVLPQFGRSQGAACSYLELGARLTAFLVARVRLLEARESLQIAFESDRDWTLIVQAIHDADASAWPPLSARLRRTNVYNIPGFAAGSAAALRYFESQRGARISRHHALCDARALRIAHMASVAFSAKALERPRSEVFSSAK